MKTGPITFTNFHFYFPFLIIPRPIDTGRRLNNFSCKALFENFPCSAKRKDSYIISPFFIFKKKASFKRVSPKTILMEIGVG
jgi:hypothetical protein